MAYPADTGRESKCFRQNGKVLVFVSGVVALEMGYACVCFPDHRDAGRRPGLEMGLARVIPRMV